MKTIQIDKAATHYADPMIMDYLSGHALQEHYDFFPKKEVLQDVVKSRSGFSQAQRDVLVQSLEEQYKSSGIDLADSPVKRQLERLRQSGCYTVTTGQQIHVGLGPMYVMYKIVDVIRLAKEVEQQAGVSVVPVFWMATEDHDLEEIKSMKVFGKSYDWTKQSGGAVGRMNTEGLRELMQSIRSDFRWDEQHLSFLDLLDKAYSLENYADASRFIVHTLFGSSGLVILDADRAELKAQFKEVMTAELKGQHKEVILASSQALADKDYPRQIHIRSCNLFHLGADSRVKLENDEKKASTGQYVSAEQASDWMNVHYQDCSPNVALRPLYQEWILPNLIYVGGPSEIKYWLQLHSIFKHYAHPMPMLIPRTSYVVLQGKGSKGLNINDMSSYYLDLEAFSQLHESELLEQADQLKEIMTGIRGGLQEYGAAFKALFTPRSIDPKLDKILGRIVDIEAVTKESLRLKMSEDPLLRKQLKIRSKYFDPLAPQERSEHWIAHAGLEDALLCQEKWSPFDNLLKINHLLLD
jgi:bacillithiol biosynthesis cysteine-adding enzyme BshC